jgi:hypothetical protein
MDGEDRVKLTGKRTNDSFFHCFQFENIKFGNVQLHRESRRGWTGYKKKYEQLIPEYAFVPQQKAGKTYLKLPHELTRNERHQKKADGKWLLGYDPASEWLLFFHHRPEYIKNNSLMAYLDGSGKEMSPYLDPSMPALNPRIYVEAFPPVSDSDSNLHFDKVLIWPEYIDTKVDSDNDYYFFLLPSIFLRLKVDYLRRVQMKIPIFKCFYDDLGNLFYHRIQYKKPTILILPKYRGSFDKTLTQLAKKLDEESSRPQSDTTKPL